MTAAPPPGPGGKREGLSNFFALWAVVLLMVTVAVVTLVANGTILTMFVLRKSLRKCKNIYIASLAAADMAIGMTVPAAALEQVEPDWVLEGFSCRVYLTLRCSLLYVSLLSILLITVDRWWSIHYPFSYRVRQSKRMAACAVAFVWVASFALNVFPVLLWEHVSGLGHGSEFKARVSGVAAYPEALMSNTSPSPLSSSSLLPSISSATLEPSPSFPPPSPSPSSLMSMLTTLAATTTSSPEIQQQTAASDVFLQKERTYSAWSSQESRQEDGGHSRHFLNTDRHCEVPYTPHFSFVLTVSVVQYFLPLLALWVLNSSLYIKITRRKSIKIRRSLSVNENYLLTFRKSSSESESSPNGQDNDVPCAVDMRSADHRQRLLASAYRQTMARRVSLQDALPGIGNMAAWAGAVPNLPRVTTCHYFGSASGLNSGPLTPMGVWLGSAPRASVCSRRKQSDDLVKEMLVRQDKKAARCLGLLVTVFTLCWLPHTVVAVLRASDPSMVASWVRDLVFWVLLLNSAINPFLYGLLNAEFRKILRGWFYFRRSKNKFRLKHALLYWSLPPNVDSDPTKENNPKGLFASPIKE
ncbi:hypothetical protein BaRGS_00030560 [Batillaria attramentaria]|uniref:G-protein coupled receptors family 1 profile domain-containing protein n=1 Tax=Batillaria attramentaria TaxID=370345 RepID=A0ABD0JU31_9CAEN